MAAAQHDEHDDHGHSTAAWVAVGLMILGSAIASVAVLLPSLALGIVGAVVIVAGGVAGKVLSMAGYGGGVGRSQSGLLVDAPDEVGTDTLGAS